jgi:hypothetical protein
VHRRHDGVRIVQIVAAWAEVRLGVVLMRQGGRGDAVNLQQALEIAACELAASAARDGASERAGVVAALAERGADGR